MLSESIQTLTYSSIGTIDLKRAADEFLKQTLVPETWIRMNTDEALAHPYLAMYHDPLDEPRVEKAFDWCFAGLDLPKNIWESLMYVFSAANLILIWLMPRRFNEMVNFKTKTIAQAVPCVRASGVNKVSSCEGPQIS